MRRKKVLLSASTRLRSACWSVLNFRHCRVTKLHHSAPEAVLEMHHLEDRLP